MGDVIIVEDAITVGQLLKSRIERELRERVLWVKTYAEAEEALRAPDAHFLVGLLDLNLPDAPDGEIVDLFLEHNTPAIVFTGGFGDEFERAIWAKGVVDYVLKEGLHDVDYIVFLVRRLRRNPEFRVLVADDCPDSRQHVASLLRIHRYQVLEAKDGLEANALLEANPDIRLLITDYHMPGMNGFDLTRKVRARFGKDDLAIIGMSAHGDNKLAARFIKNGANDFLDKPFSTEQFYCRITQNIELIDRVLAIRRAALQDYLTDIPNRRYLFEVGERLLANARRGNLSVTLAMLDIDHFKRVNDTHGHDAGDAVLRTVAQMLARRFRSSDIVCRFGGEEFCVMGVNMGGQHAYQILDDFRAIIERTPIAANASPISITVSIGVCTAAPDSLDALVRSADRLLYRAKHAGRNQVIAEPTP